MKKGSPDEGRGLTRVFEEEVQTNLVVRKKNDLKLRKKILLSKILAT